MNQRILVRFMMLVGLTTGLLAKPLTIYCENDPPSQIQNPDNSLSGFAVDLVREIQRRLHTHAPILMVPWARGYDAVQNEPNVLLFSMARTTERNALFQWIGPILENQYGFYVKADSKFIINSMEDAKKLQAIGVYRDDVRDLYLTKAGFTNLDRVTDNSVNIKKLMAGRIDAYAGSPTGIVDALETAGFKGNAVKLGFVFMKSQSFIAASRATPTDNVRAWNDALEDMKADGTFKAILAKYYPGVAMPGPAITAFG